jgi:hypothetical protein
VKVAKKVRAQAAAQVLLAGVVTVASTAAIGLAGTQDVNLTGVSASGGANTVLIDADATSIATGVSAAGGVNTVTTSGKANVTLGGTVSITTAQPLFAAVSGPIVTLTTLASSSAIGSMTVRPYARIFPTTVAATGSVGTLRSQMPPVWATVPTVEVASNTPVGTVVWTATDYVTDPDNDPMTVTMTGTLPSGLSYSSTTKQVTVTGSLTVGNSAGVVFDASDGYASPSDTETDWITRSTGSGVVWAHDFRYEREVDQFRMSNDVGPYDPSLLGGNDPTGTIGAHEVYWDSTDGIGESKCLRCVAPNGNSGFPSSSFWYGLSSFEAKVTFPPGTTYTPINSTPKGTYTFPGGSTYTYEYLDPHDNLYFAPTNTTAYFRGEQLKDEGRVSAGGWVRPFSALVAGNAGNGLPDPDRASGGETRRTYDVSNRNCFQGFRKGFYGRAAYHTAGDAGSTASDWDGTEFYVQFRVKLSSGRHATRTPPTGANSGNAFVATFASDGQTYEMLPYGKLAFVQPGPTETDGYIIIQSGQEQQYAYQTSYFQMYSHRGDFSLRDPQDSPAGAKIQNVTYGATCITGGTGGNTALAGACWEWPEDEWVTVLLYMKPGTENTGTFSLSTWTNRDTHVRAWVAREGQTSYTELLNKADFAFGWGADTLTPRGSLNNLSFNCYMNNNPAWQQFEHKYTQVIFSKQMIPCPQA